MVEANELTEMVIPEDAELGKLIMETMGTNGSWDRILGSQDVTRNMTSAVLDVPNVASASHYGDLDVRTNY